MKLLKREIIEQLKILNIKFNKKDNKKKLLNLLENSKLEEIVEEEEYEEDNWIFEDETDDEELEVEEVKENIIVEEFIDEEIINQYNLQLFSVEDKKIKTKLPQNNLQINYILERIKIVKDKLSLKIYRKQLEILRKNN